MPAFIALTGIGAALFMVRTAGTTNTRSPIRTQATDIGTERTSSTPADDLS
ncbi:hypothetical protein BZL29_6319 [Mycobacterium kansasii]|uniref:Uncharacterized protein n=1 Tax=Mycobacterium kansasii TaxID=1768 RepID=A0A1V3WUF1_MYCKA|nr:hypothetical protein BZL29_6319 [Mycobacterium kansasii]